MVSPFTTRRKVAINRLVVLRSGAQQAVEG